MVFFKYKVNFNPRVRWDERKELFEKLIERIQSFVYSPDIDTVLLNRRLDFYKDRWTFNVLSAELTNVTITLRNPEKFMQDNNFIMMILELCSLTLVEKYTSMYKALVSLFDFFFYNVYLRINKNEKDIFFENTIFFLFYLFFLFGLQDWLQIFNPPVCTSI